MVGGQVPLPIWGIAHDKVRKVDYDVIEKLCRYLNVQPGDLLVYEPNHDQDGQQVTKQNRGKEKKAQAGR